MNRLTLKKLVFTSDIPEKKPAVVDFRPGFNVISGPSDTGKTLIFECLNYILGGTNPPKDPPEAKGYTNLFLTITAGGVDFTLERSVLSHDMKVYKTDFDSITEETESTVLSGSAIAKKENISHYLLDLVGLTEKKLKRNDHNETVSLTFNILRNLLLVNEIKIQENVSPIYTGPYTDKTQEKALFRFMLTGIDYSGIIVQQRPEIRKADATARINLLQQLIGRMDVKKDTTKAELEEQLEKLSLTIEGDTNKIFQNQKNMEDLREERKAKKTSLSRKRARGFYRYSLSASRFAAMADSQRSPLASRRSLLYNNSSCVSVANSKFGPSTMASTGQASWQKPQ